jgi:tRNA nucleotidyltransferase (CCA-adding enzyme)
MGDLFQKATPILTAIEEAGFEAYFVGGAVRDYLAQRTINDVDIATSATPYEVKGIFPKTVDVGIEHGTILVLYKGESYEVTTFRIESGYSDFRRPDSVHFVRSLTDDLQRRDFTINAIAMDKAGTIIDPFFGRQAIMEKKISTVGNPDERFHEDGLRMMRAIRFVSQLGFTLDNRTFLSLLKNAHLLTHIAIERIFAEFEKLLGGTFRKRAIHLLLDSGLYTYMPHLNQKERQLRRLPDYQIEQLNSMVELWSIIVLILEVEQGDPFFKSWKMPTRQIKEIQKVTHLVKQSSDFLSNPLLLLESGYEVTIQAAKVRAVLENRNLNEEVNLAENAYQSLLISTAGDLSITGADLLIWSEDKKPGPWIKETLNSALKAVLEGKIENEKATIKEWLKQCNLI